jgi:sirohydrochlorin cobaltochelatase
MLIVIAHGSRNPAWRASVERQVEKILADLEPDSFRIAYMELSPPTLMDVVSEAVQHGIVRIRVLPLFLAAEGHVENNVYPLVTQAREAFSSVSIELLPPVGQHRLFRELLRTIATEETL